MGQIDTVKEDKKPVANPYVILREEFDDWAVLFNPDTGRGFGLNPTGVYVWKLLDGKHSIQDMVRAFSRNASSVTDDVSDHVEAFVDQLMAEGLAGLDNSVSALLNTTYSATLCPERRFFYSPRGLNEVARFNYEPPKLVNLSGQAQVAHGDCHNTGSQNAVSCTTGHIAGPWCQAGSSAGGTCDSNGNSPGVCCWTSGTSGSSINGCFCGDCDTFTGMQCHHGGANC